MSVSRLKTAQAERLPYPLPIQSPLNRDRTLASALVALRVGTAPDMSSVHGKHAEKCSTNHTPGTHIRVDVCKLFKNKGIIWWRRGESNPRPKSATTRSLHA